MKKERVTRIQKNQQGRITGVLQDHPATPPMEIARELFDPEILKAMDMEDALAGQLSRHLVHPKD